MSYFFEEESADVMGYILSISKNSSFSIETLSEATNIHVDSLLPFLTELVSINILTTKAPTRESIAQYRQQVSANRIESHQKSHKTTLEKLPMAVSSAEMDYMDHVGGIGSVMFELTYRCTEQCIHCYNIGATRTDTDICHRADREELSFEDYRRIIDELYEQGLFKVCLSGGDPFSKDIIWYIIEYLVAKDIAVDIYTNGQRALNYHAAFTSFYPRAIGVSLYSGIAEVHDSITRVKGSFDKSIRFIDEMSKLAVPLAIKCCVMRQNVATYSMVSDIATQYGAETQYELNITDSIDGDKCASKHLRLTPDILEIVLQDDKTPMYVGKELPNYGGQPKEMSRNGCGAGVNTFCITPEGYFTPCCAFHTIFGELKRQSVSDILQHSESLQYWRELTLNDYEECGKHEYCPYCNLCPGNNFTEHGTPLKCSECNEFMAKARYTLAQKLQNGEAPLSETRIREQLIRESKSSSFANIKRESSMDFSNRVLQKVGK